MRRALFLLIVAAACAMPIDLAVQAQAGKPLDIYWQLHWSYAGGVEHNAPGVMIANIDDRDQLAAVLTGAATPPAGAGGMAAHTPAHYIKVSARTGGSFTVTNSRNGYSKTYAARP
jgi:hypothetical protein